MKSNFTLLLLLSSSLVFGQNLEIDWANFMVGPLGITSTGIKEDASGNIYVSGYFSGTADLNPGTEVLNYTSAGLTDIFVQKLDPNGNLVWAVTFGGTNHDRFPSLDVDPSGNVFLTGYYRETVDFDPGTSTHNLTSLVGEDIFILKLNTDAILQWVHAFGSTGNDRGISITVDTNGDVIATGSFASSFSSPSSVDFDPGAGETILNQGNYIAKYSTFGDLIWAKEIYQKLNGSSPSNLSARSDANDNIYVTGTFSNTIDLDTDNTTAEFELSPLIPNVKDVLVFKMDANGNPIWINKLEGSNTKTVSSMDVSDTGELVVSGTFQSTIQYDLGDGVVSSSSNGSVDVFNFKMNTDGGFEWVNTFGDISTDFSNSITFDDNEDIFTVGRFWGTIDVDPSATTYNLFNPFPVQQFGSYLVKYENGGNFLFAGQLESPSGSTGTFHVIHPSGENLLVSGLVDGSTDLDPDLFEYPVMTEDPTYFLSKMIPEIINETPVVSNPIVDQEATEDEFFEFQFPTNTFEDANGDELIYTALLSDDTALPAWLSFQASTRTFSGTPDNDDVLSLPSMTIIVTANDGNDASVFDDFLLEITNTNDAPIVINPIPNQQANEDEPFSFQFAENTFDDPDFEDEISYTISTSLPSWLSFNPTDRSFSGTPLNSDVGIFSIMVTATDLGSLTTFTEFSFTVNQVNDAPTVTNQIPDQTASADQNFSFQLASNTFEDIDSGDNLTLSASLQDDTALPKWLIFTSSNQTFSGIPTQNDLGIITIKVTATDDSDASAFDEFDLDVTTVAATNELPVLFSVSPNPAIDKITVIIQESGKHSIQLYSIDGQLYKELIVNKERTELDLSALPNGIYLLRIEGNGKSNELRILKN